jgi:hypothetical protein
MIQHKEKRMAKKAKAKAKKKPVRVAVFTSIDEVLVFAVDKDDRPIGTKPYLQDGGRDPNDYDIKICNLPVGAVAHMKLDNWD